MGKGYREHTCISGKQHSVDGRHEPPKLAWIIIISSYLVLSHVYTYQTKFSICGCCLSAPEEGVVGVMQVDCSIHETLPCIMTAIQILIWAVYRLHSGEIYADPCLSLIPEYVAMIYDQYV